MRKKIVSLAMAAALMAVTVTGCSASSNLTGDEIVAEFGDTKISAGLAEFYARYEQAQYETYYMSYYGEDMWSMKVDGNMTYEDSVKNNVLNALETMYVLESHMGDYNLEFTAEEENAVKEAAQAFVEANDAEALKAIFGTEENVAEVLKLYTIQQKMYTAMIADADTEVSDEEAAQKSMDYVFFAFETEDEEGNSVTLTDEEKAELKETASSFQVAVASGEKTFEEYAEEYEVEATTVTFDSESVSPDKDLIAAADVLGEGQVTDIIETEKGYYVAKVTSLLDREATDAEKESIVSDRQRTLFNDLCEQWMEEAEITEHEDIWNQVDFEKKGVTIKADEKESSEDTDTEE